MSKSLPVPPAAWNNPSDYPPAQAGRRSGFRHRRNGATTEDSGVDALAALRRDKDYGPTAPE